MNGSPGSDVERRSRVARDSRWDVDASDASGVLVLVVGLAAGGVLGFLLAAFFFC